MVKSKGWNEWPVRFPLTKDDVILIHDEEDNGIEPDLRAYGSVQLPTGLQWYFWRIISFELLILRCNMSNHCYSLMNKPEEKNAGVVCNSCANQTQ